MPYLLFALLLGGALLVALAGAPALRTAAAGPPDPSTGSGQRLRAVLTGRLRELERRADRLPVVGPEIARGRRRELHYVVRDRLPSFWGDLSIYLREARRDLRGALLAAIDRLHDPLSRTLAHHLQRTQLGSPLDAALRAAADEIGYRPLSAGVQNLLATQERGGDLVQLLNVLRDQAMAQVAFERREQTATLENRLILFLWPILFAALMLAILLPIAVSGMGAFFQVF
jgi:hypothetical protein